jgi:hypothetical protein
MIKMLNCEQRGSLRIYRIWHTLNRVLLVVHLMTLSEIFGLGVTEEKEVEQLHLPLNCCFLLLQCLHLLSDLLSVTFLDFLQQEFEDIDLQLHNFFPFSFLDSLVRNLFLTLVFAFVNPRFNLWQIILIYLSLSFKFVKRVKIRNVDSDTGCVVRHVSIQQTFVGLFLCCLDIGFDPHFVLKSAHFSCFFSI